MSVATVAAPGPRANLPPVEWLPPRPEAVFSADARENADFFVQTEAPLLSLTSRSLSNPVAAPLASSSDRLLPLENEFVDLVPFSIRYPRDLIIESMATPAQLPGATISFSDRSVSQDLVSTGNSFAGLAAHEELDSSGGSVAGLPTALPETRLSEEVIFVGEGPAFASYGGPPTGHSAAAMAQSVPMRSEGVSAAADTFRNLATFLGNRLDTSSGDNGGLTQSMLGQSSVQSASNPESNGIPVASPASTSDLESSATARLVGSLPADSADAAEGGYVEIDNTPLTSGLFSPIRQTPTWSDDGGNASDTLAQYGQHGDVPPGVSGIVKDIGQPAEMRSEGVVQPELADLDSARAANAAEGGMVELAAASSDARPISTQSPTPEHGDPLPNVKEIELDNGLGLFHAFELATAPALHGDQVNPGSEKTGEALPPEAHVSPTPLSPTATKDSASENNDLNRQATLRPTILSSVLLAAMFVPIGSVRRQKRSSEYRPSSP
ncbi:MAG: hypothetical protein WCB27_19135 [Thermoguttaceae bacterium]